MGPPVGVEGRHEIHHWEAAGPDQGAEASADLDLLLFFARHPRALRTSEDLAAYVGYDLRQIARSLDILIDAKIVKRLQNPTHSARMYVLDTYGSPGGWLPALLRLASTHDGRAGAVAILRARAMAGPDAAIYRKRHAAERELEVAHAWWGSAEDGHQGLRSHPCGRHPARQPDFGRRRRQEFAEPGLIVLFEVSPDRIMREAALFGWDLRDLERQGRIKILFTTRRLFEPELQQADSLLLEQAREIGARRVFVDSFAPVNQRGDNGPPPRESFHVLAEGSSAKTSPRS
jgi:hypothetical protein